jgi:hypothetical protein
MTFGLIVPKAARHQVWDKPKMFVLDSFVAVRKEVVSVIFVFFASFAVEKTLKLFEPQRRPECFRDKLRSQKNFKPRRHGGHGEEKGVWGCGNVGVWAKTAQPVQSAVSFKTAHWTMPASIRYA